jgi:hypothetical protein
LWGGIGLLTPLLAGVLQTTVPWLVRDVPVAIRQIYWRWLVDDVPLPMLACAMLMACGAAATYFPRGRWRLSVSTAIVGGVSVAAWILEFTLFSSQSAQNFMHRDDTEALLTRLFYVVHAPLLAATLVIILRFRVLPTDDTKTERVVSKTLLARLDFPIAVICAYVLSLMFWPAPARAVEVALRARCIQNLQQLAVAAHEYRQHYGRPLDDVRSADGRLLLSWRVAILPFLHRADLQGQFRLDEPWDSPHNAQLLRGRPDVFACPRAIADEECTNYVLVNDQGRMVIIEAGRSCIPWTKPDGKSDEVNDGDAGVGAHPGCNWLVNLNQFPLPPGARPVVEFQETDTQAEP